MNIEERISAFAKLGDQILDGLKNNQTKFEEIIIKAKVHNPWFDPKFTKKALEALGGMLSKGKLTEWVEKYKKSHFNESGRVVGVIMAGNIPLVGFHDFLSVLIVGKVFKGKLSSQDEFLLVFLADLLIEIEPRFRGKIEFVPHLLKDFDAVIATGSNNSSRYFDYYFGKYPHIIRHSRNSIGIIAGDETEDDLKALSNDIYMYFGLGCRSVSKIYLPKGYDITKLIDSTLDHSFIAEHTKYFNNYEYNKSIFLLNKVPHLDNGFCLFTKEESLSSPISVVYYEEYDDIEELEIKLLALDNQIQCIVGGESLKFSHNKLGLSQYPTLSEYADNVDVISFLGELE